MAEDIISTLGDKENLNGKQMKLQSLLSKRTALFQKQYEIVKHFYDIYAVVPSKDELKNMKRINKKYLAVHEQIIDIEDSIHELDDQMLNSIAKPNSVDIYEAIEDCMVHERVVRVRHKL